MGDKTVMPLRIGYLVGQFPSSAQTFIWRDVCAIERQGVEVALLSTRPPKREPARHAWAPAAKARTLYLMDDPAALMTAFLRAAATRPGGVFACLAAISRLDLGPVELAKVLALIVPAARLAAVSKARGLSHIHVPFPLQSAYVALLAQRLGGVPYSLGIHNSVEIFNNVQAKFADAAFAIAITELLRDELRVALGAAAPEEIVIAPMGVDLDLFTRRKLFQPWTGSGRARLFSCGRGVVTKGHEDTVEALAILVERGLDAELVIAGEFPPGDWFTRHLKDRIRELGLEERVTIAGALTENRVVEELEACHLFVLPSHEEGLGIAIAEAMAMEVPVVATRIGGIPVLIESGVHGLLVDARAPDQLAQALATVLKSPGMALQFGRSARAKIAARFTADTGAAALVSTLRRRYPQP
jgi:glycosyltransferase involved in cell wall biosynthesis